MSPQSHVFGNQHPIVPPNLNDLNLPPNLLNALSTMAVIQTNVEYSPQSPEPSDPLPISNPPMNLSTIEDWETSHTTTDDAIFYSEDEPRRVYWEISSCGRFDYNEPRRVSITSSSSSTPPPPRRQNRKLSLRISLPQKKGASQHTYEAYSQLLPTRKTP